MSQLLRSELKESVKIIIFSGNLLQVTNSIEKVVSIEFKYSFKVEWLKLLKNICNLH